MPGMFVRFDELLIERLFQPLCALAARNLGIGRDAAARCCVDAASLAWILARAGTLSASAFGLDAGGAAMNVGTLLIGLIALVALRAVFSRAHRSRSGNALRHAMRPHRAVILLLLLGRLLRMQAPGLADLADAAMLVLAASALYLGACAEPPPVRRDAVLSARQFA